MIRFEMYKKNDQGVDRLYGKGVQFDNGEIAVHWQTIPDCDVMIYRTMEKMLHLHGENDSRIEWIDTLTLPVLSAESRKQLRQSLITPDEDEL